eukprot:2693786-Pyramimonas_sp.AAC.1
MALEEVGLLGRLWRWLWRSVGAVGLSIPPNKSYQPSCHAWFRAFPLPLLLPLQGRVYPSPPLDLDERIDEVSE